MAAPFGDIFQVATPALDQLSNRLYAQQQQIDTDRANQIKGLDDEFRKSITNIKSADIPEFSKAYDEYRTARIAQLKNPSTDRSDYFNQQTDVNQKLAKAYGILNDSVTEKAALKELSSKILSNPLRYNDNALDLVKQRMGIPTSQLSTYQAKDANGNPINLNSEDAYIYKGGTDFSKNIKNAFGNKSFLDTLDETQYPKDKNTPQPIQKTFGKYSGFNSPYLAYSQLVSSLADPRQASNFIKTHQFTPEVEQQIENRFNKIVSDPTYQRLYGLQGNETFNADDTELGHAAKMAIMLSTTPPSRDEIYKTDEAAKMAQQNKYTMGHIWYNAMLNGKGGQTYNVKDLQLPDGTTDLTKPLQGIKVNNTVTGKSFNSDNIKYDPQRKEITYHDILDNKTYTVPASTFRTTISTINTVQDLKTFDNLLKGIDKAFTKPSTQSKGKQKLNW